MKRSFVYLTVLTAIAILALLLIPENNSQDSSGVDNLLVPAVSERINDVDRVEIVSAGNVVVATMVRSNAGWQLQQMGGYHASWKNLQTLLAGLAQAKVIAIKTDKAEYYSRLGVENIDQNTAASILLKISIGDEETGILVGHQAQARQGQYVRLQGKASSFEIDRKLDVSTELLNWVDSSIIDINQSEVAEVEIIHADGERLLVTRISADQLDFDLVGLPSGREIQSSWSVNSLGSVLSMLDMESVRPASDIDWDKAVKIRLLMFSGVEVLADLLVDEDVHLLRLHASHPAAEVIGEQASTKHMSDQQLEIEERAAVDIADRVASINQKVDGWVYAISKQKSDVINSRMEGLLKPQESP